MSQAGILSDSGGSGGNDIRTITGNSGGAVSGDPSFNVNIIGAGTLTVTGSPGTNTLTIADSNTVWSRVSTNTSMVINGGYTCVAPGGNLLMLLPATAPVGATIQVTLSGATSFTISQPIGVFINFNDFTTTAGPTGNIKTVDTRGSTVELVCITANTEWEVVDSNGNFEIN